MTQRLVSYPSVSGAFELVLQLNSIQLPLVLGSITFGPWLCSLLISVASHPLNEPHHIRWFFTGSLASIILTLIWMQWIKFTPTLSSIHELPFNFSPVVIAVFSLLIFSFVLCIVVILLSINVWLRWLTR
jgi:hypothetical protein